MVEDMDEKDMVVMLACVHERGRAAGAGATKTERRTVSLAW